MTFLNSATEALDRAEAALQELIADAAKAKAYREIAAIAALAESLAAITTGRPSDGQRTSANTDTTAGPVVAAAAAAVKEAPPAWMWPKTQ